MAQIVIDEWKDIPNFEGYYQANKNGEIRSVTRRVKKHNGYKMVYGRVLKPTQQRYQIVRFSKDGVVSAHLVHRIIAETFFRKMRADEVVNHLDGNKHNNTVANLEICSQKQNIAHAMKTLQVDYKKHPMARKIMRSDGTIFNSINEAAKQSYVSRGNIWRQMHGKIKTANGYTFKFIGANR